jgi:hypothetical protein
LLDPPPFVIEKPWLGFLIAGTNQPYDLSSGGQQRGVTAVNLLVDGVPVRTMTGTDRNRLEWHYWDVRDLAGQTATIQIIDSSLTGFLLVDEFMQTTRTQLRDISSSRQAAELVNDPVFTTQESAAVLGQSLALDGIDDHVIASSLEALNGKKAMTLSLWVQIETRDRDQVILSKGGAPNGFAITFETESKTLQWRVGSTTVSSDRVINNGSWHFIAATFEAGNGQGLRIWVDDASTVGTASTAGLAQIPNGDAPLILGGFYPHQNGITVRLKASKQGV